MTAEDSKRPPDVIEPKALQCDSIGSPAWVANTVDRIRLLAQSRAEKHPPNRPSSPADAWPAPQPLVARLDRVPYPVDALPETIREAVEEIQGYTKAPLPLAASSALAVVSLACQAHVDVRRDAQLSGPTSLYMLAIADSGERKTSCDKHFMEAIEQYEAAQRETAKPAVKSHKAELEAWVAKRDGKLSALKETAKKGKQTHDLEQQLEQLERAKPEPPIVPRLIYGDATPEALAFDLANRWPSAGVMANEAGSVFGAHGMAKDSVMRNLAMLNTLWDGGTLRVDRRTTESFVVKGARVTMGLMIQEQTLRSFFEKTGPLARGIGFLARFLVSLPESTQGTRFYTEPPESTPKKGAFNRRIADILNRPVTLDESGGLVPEMLTMRPEAKASWAAIHDEVERQLGSGGELSDVRDVAAKAADNVARLSALFHVFEGESGPISANSVSRAGRIVVWHLNESRRFFGELALPPELADPARLDAWLIAYCKRERTLTVPTRDTQRLGPIRDKTRLSAALAELEELNRVRLTQNERRKSIEVNPALVES